MSSGFYPGQPTQYSSTRQTGVTNVAQQRRSRSRGPAPIASTTSPYALATEDYSGQSALQIPQYATHQSNPINVPQQQQRTLRPHSISPHTSSLRVDYPEQSGAYPSSYNSGRSGTALGTTGTQAHLGYSDPVYDWGQVTVTQGDPGFPEPHSPAGGAIERSHSGQSASLYPPASGSGAGHPGRRRPSAGQSDTLYAPGSIQRSHSGQSDNFYAPTSSSVPRGYSGQSASATYYPSGAQTYDATNSSYAAGPPLSTSPYSVSRGHGGNASDGSRPPGGQHLYQTATPTVTRLTPEPPYREPHYEGSVASSRRQPRDVYEYDNLGEGQMADPLPKGPGQGPAQGRQHTCRFPGCNRPMYFDRRVNEFWEWCSPQHIHEGLGRGVEKVCKRCGVWPRRYGQKYCGGDGCNKKGLPI